MHAAALFYLPAPLFAEIGIGLKGAFTFTSSDAEDIVDELKENGKSSSFDKNQLTYGAELLIETPGANRLGVKGAAMFSAKTEGDVEDKFRIELRNINIPVTLYYKYAPNDTGLHLWGGAGPTIFIVKNKGLRLNGLVLESYNETETKVGFNISAGIEARLLKSLGIGLDLGYTFVGDIDDDGDNDVGYANYNPGGFNIGLAARLYF